MTKSEQAALQSDLLKQVSRSFYLSMRFLPGRMQTPVSLGYLLARASDTLADTREAPVELRRECLVKFCDGIAGWKDESAFQDFYLQVVRDFRPHQVHEGERDLLLSLPEVFDWLNRVNNSDRSAVVDVLEKITLGQLWDLDHFGGSDPGRPAMVESATDLETYTYRVAGCVGEFWTTVGLNNLGSRFAARSSESDLLQWGSSLGQGLQLVNILRDLGEDLDNGRCYLPREDLEAAGWKGGGQDGLPPSELLMEVAAKWRTICRQKLESGHQYVKTLKRGRGRFATALPLILAEETLKRIEEAGAQVLKEKVKIGRADVRKAMGRAWLL